MTDSKVKKLEREGMETLHIHEDKPLEWFEGLYAAADKDGSGVPWANMTTHSLFAAWLERHGLDGAGKSALVVGCGMGDDAIELESRGFAVTAFDVADSAIAHCKERFSDSKVEFMQADLFNPPQEWAEKFDFVLEVYTVQAVPPVYEEPAIKNIARFVAPEGRLLVIAEVREGERSFDKGPPWLLTPAHVEAFAAHDLTIEERVVGEVGERCTSYTTTFRRA